MSPSLPKEPFEPMLARATDMPEGAGWVYEPKLDGLRCIAYVQHGAVRLVSRQGKPIMSFPDIEQALASLPDCVLDGEVCVHDVAGAPRFNLLQQRTNIKGQTLMRARARVFPATYHVFDVLSRAGLSLLTRSLETRKGLLRYLLAQPAVGHQVRYVEHHADGQALLAAMHTAGGEGIMAKNLHDPYMPGSRRGWVKVKFRESDEYAVVGWVDGTGWRAGGIGALLVATPTGESFYYVAKVGTGMTVEMLEDLLALVKPLAISDCPVDNPPKGEPHWIKPDRLVVEVEFQHRTNDGSLRHPAFKGIRWDKKVADL